MQMIDVLKRLAELDATNTNVVPAKTMVKENADLAECGPMGMMGDMQERPAMPASINMTAGSGEELSDMLATIMQLAGVHKVEPAHMGMDHDPMTLTAEPAVVAGPHASDGEVMRGVLDKMNPEMDDEEGEEETDEAQYDNTPADPRKTEPFDSEEFAHHENQPGQGDRMDGNMPKATMEQQLMAAYKEFVSEGSKQVSEISTALVNKVHNARELNRDIASNANSDEHSARIQAKADSMGKSKWDRSVTAEPGPLAAAADAAQQKFDRNKKLTIKRPNSNYGRDQAELGAWGQRVGQSQGSGQSVWRK